MALIRFIVLSLALVTLLACLALNSKAEEPPSTSRSRSAIAKIKPTLEKALQKKNLNLGSPIFIRIFKESNELEMWVENNDKFELFQTYKICSFSGHLGPKLQTGDLQSPEGFYYVMPIGMNPASQFHLSFNLGFPNTYDRYYGRTGSYLMVHGNCVSIGCYAMTDAKIEEIYALADAALRGGQPFFRVHVFPFRMTPANMKKHRGSRWIPFWENLKEGYNYFERESLPPNVNLVNGKYAFDAP